MQLRNFYVWDLLIASFFDGLNFPTPLNTSHLHKIRSLQIREGVVQRQNRFRRKHRFEERFVVATTNLSWMTGDIELNTCTINWSYSARRILSVLLYLYPRYVLPKMETVCFVLRWAVNKRMTPIITTDMLLHPMNKLNCDVICPTPYRLQFTGLIYCKWIHSSVVTRGLSQMTTKVCIFVCLIEHWQEGKEASDICFLKCRLSALAYEKRSTACCSF